MVDVIVGGEDVEREKPDPAGLSAAVERLDVAPAALLYVGDSPTDAETARRAGVRFAADALQYCPAPTYVSTSRVRMWLR